MKQMAKLSSFFIKVENQVQSCWGIYWNFEENESKQSLHDNTEDMNTKDFHPEFLMNSYQSHVWTYMSGIKEWTKSDTTKPSKHDLRTHGPILIDNTLPEDTYLEDDRLFRPSRRFLSDDEYIPGRVYKTKKSSKKQSSTVGMKNKTSKKMKKKSAQQQLPNKKTKQTKKKSKKRKTTTRTTTTITKQTKKKSKKIKTKKQINKTKKKRSKNPGKSGVGDGGSQRPRKKFRKLDEDAK